MAGLRALPFFIGVTMNKTQIISRANARTEKRAEGVLDLDAEYFDALQEFCEEYRFSWRKKSATFNTVVGTALYDITLTDGETVLSCEEMISVQLVASDGSTSDVTPAFAGEGVLLDSIATGMPTQYVKDEENGILLSPIPDAEYKIRIICWALPKASVDSIPETVPLIPERYHRAVEKCLEKNLLSFSQAGTAQHQAAIADYVKLRDEAIAKSDFATGRVLSFKTSDTAVRSTR